MRLALRTGACLTLAEKRSFGRAQDIVLLTIVVVRSLRMTDLAFKDDEGWLHPPGRILRPFGGEYVYSCDGMAINPHFRESDDGQSGDDGCRGYGRIRRGAGFFLLLDGGTGSVLRAGGEGSVLRDGAGGRRRVRLPVVACTGTFGGTVDATSAVPPRTHLHRLVR